MSQLYVGNIITRLSVIDAPSKQYLLLVSVDPRTGGGVDAGVGSIAIGPGGAIYQKTSAPTTGWAPGTVAI